MPFTAKLMPEGRPVSLLDAKDATAIGEAAAGSFACKGCGSTMILRRGVVDVTGTTTVRRAHFMHKPQQRDPSCPMLDYERAETEYHREGKRYFARHLEDVFPALRTNKPTRVEVECRIPAINRIADLYVETAEGDRFAIEIQYSPISEDELRQRSADYLAAGITPMWALRDAVLTDGVRRVIQEYTLPHVRCIWGTSA